MRVKKTTIKKISFHISYNPRVLLAVVIVFYLINSFFYLNAQSITSDEGSFLNYAIRYIKGHPERVAPVTDNSKMPVSVLNLIPRIAEQVIHPSLKKSDNGFSDIMMGRYVTLIISIFSILLVFKWAKEMYGARSAVFAAFLFSFCPNNLANASLVTTDSYSVLLLLLNMYLLWKFCKTNSIKYFVYLSVAVAVAQVVKQSLFHLYILIPVILLVHFIYKKKKLNLKRSLYFLISFGFINWLLINGFYFFNGSNLSLGSYNFMSHLFQSVQRVLPSKLIVPLPKPFVDGLDMAKFYDQVGGGTKGLSSFGKVTILGHEATGGSFWYYYFVSLFFKTPIAYFLLLIFALILYARKKTRTFFENELFLLVPVIYFVILFSFFYKTQCGLRHIIFIFPLIFIFISSVIGLIQNKAQKYFVAIASVYLVVSVLFFWRNYYPYTNEFICNKKNAYQYIGAGNLEFLQGKYFAEKYLQQHPQVKFVPEKAENGLFLIDTENYLDVWNLHRYDWIKQYKPVDHVAYSWLLIKVENVQ